MKFKLLLIIFLNIFFFISCIEVKLNFERNGTISNYTVIDKNNTKNELFMAEKLFFSKCKCSFNNEIFYISPKYNLINFTINTTENSFNNSKIMKIEKPNLNVNSKDISINYNLTNINNQIYKFQIQTICKNPYFKPYHYCSSFPN